MNPSTTPATDLANLLTGAGWPALPPVRVVDVGANPIDGAPPYARLLQAGRAEIVGFEPNPNALAVLQAKAGPHETYLPCALGDGGTHTLHLCAAPGMTSLYEPDPAVLALFHGFPAWGRVQSTETVATRRMDDIPETSGAHLLKLDVQGAELMVLRHAAARVASALVVQAEVEFLPLYRGQPLFSEVEQFCRSHGLIFHRFFPAVSRCFTPMVVGGSIYSGLSQTVWGDALFVRGLLNTDELTATELLLSASILHDCYESYDLVLRLLLAHDHRVGTVMGPAYLQALQTRQARDAARAQHMAAQAA